MAEVDQERKPARDIRLEEIMHSAVSVSPEAAAHEALKVMIENRIPALPVVSADGKLEGIITDALLLDSAVPQYLKFMESVSFVSEDADKWVHYMGEAADKTVREVMSSEVSQIELGQSELAAAHRMVHDGVPSVVITRDGKAVGIVGRLDLYAAICGLG